MLEHFVHGIAIYKVLNMAVRKSSRVSIVLEQRHLPYRNCAGAERRKYTAAHLQILLRHRASLSRICSQGYQSIICLIPCCTLHTRHGGYM